MPFQPLCSAVVGFIIFSSGQFTTVALVTDYGRPERKQPSLHGRKFTPTPKFLGTGRSIYDIFDLYLHLVSAVCACTNYYKSLDRKKQMVGKKMPRCAHSLILILNKQRMYKNQRTYSVCLFRPYAFYQSKGFG